MRRAFLYIIYVAVWLVPLLLFGALVLRAFETQGALVGIAAFFVGGGIISYLFRAIWARMWGEPLPPVDMGIEFGGDGGDGGGD